MTDIVQIEASLESGIERAGEMKMSIPGMDGQGSHPRSAASGVDRVESANKGRGMMSGIVHGIAREKGSRKDIFVQDLFT